MRRIGLLACVALLSVAMGGCSGGAGQSGTLYLKSGEAERLYLFGETPSLSVRNMGEDAVPVEIQSGAATTSRDSVPAGGTRSWSASGPWTFLFSNPSARDVVIQYTVSGGEAVE